MALTSNLIISKRNSEISPNIKETESMRKEVSRIDKFIFKIIKF
jgi:hypothetical protein